MISKIEDIIRAHKIEYIDLRFTDFLGMCRHMTTHVAALDDEFFLEGIMFDGSSLKGWKSVDASDMILRPDLTSYYIDPFAAYPTMILFCDVVDPAKQDLYDCDPRSLSKRVLGYLAQTGLADEVCIGPEAEFFIFDSVKANVSQYDTSVSLNINHPKPFVSNCKEYREIAKEGYAQLMPRDEGQDIRCEMVSILQKMGIQAERHHHEASIFQHEIRIKYSNLLDIADKFQLLKYVVRMVAQSYGKTATFMPKPLYGENGSGLHVNQSLFKQGKNLFVGEKYGGLSELALFYIGGILKHAKALNAFTNPSTNSYKRLFYGYEAPIFLAYSSANRSVGCRIPLDIKDHGRRVEVRFPDPLANPYLAFSALLMAGLDGILNRIHPGQSNSSNLYACSEEDKSKIPCVARSLEEALLSLKADYGFLLQGNVFSESFIERYIALKMNEVNMINTHPHPMEYEMYYEK